jgi:hypothetical protein
MAVAEKTLNAEAAGDPSPKRTEGDAARRPRRRAVIMQR